MMGRKNVLSGLGLEGKRPVCSSRKRSRGPAELLMVRNSHQLAEKEKHHLQSQLWMEVISCKSNVTGALVPWCTAVWHSSTRTQLSLTQALPL